MRPAHLLVGLVGTCVMAAGCTVANSGHGGYDVNTLRIVLPEEPPTLEPCESSLTSTGVVVRSNITEPLIERDPGTGDLAPLLATGWRRTSDTEWTFEVRRGVNFSDGTPLPPPTPRSPSTAPSTATCSATSMDTCSATTR
jgi:peptide/nickel transport system substrate-binding protein